MSKLKIATCQFSVSADIRRNARQIEQAKKMRADVVHFWETVLSGYAGTDYKTWEGFDWDLLVEETEAICALAKEKKVWVILVSAHQLTGKNKPHNSLYAIGPDGKIVDRYDKCFCIGGDLKYYSSGDHLSILNINQLFLDQWKQFVGILSVVAEFIYSARWGDRSIA